jgi:hypothetical protein
MADGFSEWLPVISTLSGGVLAFGAALVVNKVNHRYALERETLAVKERQHHERQLADDAKQKELFFIGTELVCLLELFSDRCSDVVCDTEPNKKNWSVKSLPLLSLEVIEGDWRTLPPELLFHIRSLPAQNREARYVIEDVFLNGYPPEVTECACYQYARLGVKVLLMAYRLRRVCGLPPPRDGERCRTNWRILWRNRRAFWRNHLIIQKKAMEDI